MDAAGNAGLAASEISSAAGDNLQDTSACLLTAAKNIAIEYSKGNDGHGSCPDQSQTEWNYGDEINQYNQQGQPKNQETSVW